MNSFANYLGYLLILALALSGLALAIGGICAVLRHFIDTRYEDAKRAAMLEMAGRLFQDAYWYSQDSTTMWLLQRIATDITTHGWSDASQRRDEWIERKLAESGSLNQISKVR